MADPGFISGLIGLGIAIAAKEISEHIKLALYCKKELNSLKVHLNSIGPINTAIQKYRMGLKLGQIVIHEPDMISPPAVNDWLKRLNTLVTEANEIAEQCCIQLPTYNVFSRYKMSKRIRKIAADMEEHLRQASMIGITAQLASNMKLGQGLQRIEHKLDEMSTPSTSSGYPTQRLQAVHEPLIVGQGEVFSQLQKKVVDREQGLSCMGVVAMGGAGKTLLLRTVLNSKEVRESFMQDIVLWLTVSHIPSLSALRRSLGRQIALQINENFNERNDDDDYVRPWIQEKMGSRRFLLFLDDVWESSSGSEDLLEALGVPAETVDDCKIVVSTRDRRVLTKMKVTRPNTINLGSLSEDESWALFKSHAFAYNNYQVPSVDVEQTAVLVSKECDGLPLAIKVIAATMAGATDPAEWEVALERLQNADKLNPEVERKLYNRLRLSYDALGRYDPALQLCYLYIGAFKEDEDMYLDDLINLWIGEGLVTTNRPGEDPLEIGRAQANLLVDRCLIEATVMDADGHVMVCSMHDVLHDLALQIAEEEENCYYRPGRNLQLFPADSCSTRSRISLMENSFASIPDAFEGGQILSMLLSENTILKHFPAQAMATMTRVRVLDLGGTSLEQLPASLGSMKQLVCLRLARVPILTLPESMNKLRKLQILDLSTCNKLKQLPVGIGELISLRYLDLSYCQSLNYLPPAISRLTSLQYLRTEGSWQAWGASTRTPDSLWKKTQAKFCFRVVDERNACFKDLHTLTQLKWLGIEDSSAIIENGMLGSMTEMRTVVMRLARVSALPDDMKEMVKMRTLYLRCRDLITTPPWLSEFQHLNCLILSDCDKLKELCALQRLPRLRRLDIVSCAEMKELPAAFGETGAFTVLERFWLEKMWGLENLPVLNDGAMPLLKKLGLVGCPKLKLLPPGFFKLQHLQQMQVYGCPLVLQRMEEGGEDWENVRQLQNERGVEVIKEYIGDKRLKEISKRMGNKYWWDRLVKEKWMNFHM